MPIIRIHKNSSPQDKYKDLDLELLNINVIITAALRYEMLNNEKHTKIFFYVLKDEQGTIRVYKDFRAEAYESYFYIIGFLKGKTNFTNMTVNKNIKSFISQLNKVIKKL
jgi:hypothetical protein